MENIRLCGTAGSGGRRWYSESFLIRILPGAKPAQNRRKTKKKRANNINYCTTHISITLFSPLLGTGRQAGRNVEGEEVLLCIKEMESAGCHVKPHHPPAKCRRHRHRHAIGHLTLAKWPEGVAQSPLYSFALVHARSIYSQSASFGRYSVGTTHRDCAYVF